MYVEIFPSICDNLVAEINIKYVRSGVLLQSGLAFGVRRELIMGMQFVSQEKWIVESAYVYMLVMRSSGSVTRALRVK
jgi:hypothetical protein